MCKSYSNLVFNCANFYYADFDRELIDLSGFQVGPTFPSILTVNCPVSNHFYFKEDSKYLLNGNKISD